MATGLRRDLSALGERVPRRIREHNVTLMSAGIAFYAFLAFVPALIVIVTVYGFVANPDEITGQVESFARALPEEVEHFIAVQITRIARADTTGASVTLAVALVVALWSASSGMAGLIAGVSVARGRRTPSFVAKRGKALVLVAAVVVLLVVLMFLITALPPLLGDVGLAPESRIVLNVVRWPVLAVIMVSAIGVLYRVAVPDHPRGRTRVITRGAVVATLLWLLASGLFAVYTANYGRYSETYGSLSSIIVVLLWLFLSAFAVLLGAEVDGVDHEIEEAGAAIPAPAGPEPVRLRWSPPRDPVPDL
jgi:membrane protein